LQVRRELTPARAILPGRLRMYVLAAVAEFERSVIVERINAGLAAARARGATLGPPRTLDRHRSAVARLSHRGLSGRKIAAKLSIPVGSLFSVIKSVRAKRPARSSSDRVAAVTNALDLLNVYLVNGSR
jgi:DNA invertase Pin-like site-specific DNA recombinase